MNALITAACAARIKSESTQSDEEVYGASPPYLPWVWNQGCLVLLNWLANVDMGL